MNDMAPRVGGAAHLCFPVPSPAGGLVVSNEAGQRCLLIRAPAESSAPARVDALPKGALQSRASGLRTAALREGAA